MATMDALDLWKGSFLRQRTYFPKDKNQEKKRFALNVPWKKKTSNNIPPETEEQNASDTKQ